MRNPNNILGMIKMGNQINRNILIGSSVVVIAVVVGLIIFFTTRHHGGSSTSPHRTPKHACSDCSSDEVCVDGKCVPKPSTCNNDNDCPGENVCLHNTCVPKSHPPVASPCENSHDCYPMVCGEDSHCKKCTRTQECAWKNEVCLKDKGVCGTCESDGDCRGSVTGMCSDPSLPTKAQCQEKMSCQSPAEGGCGSRHDDYCCGITDQKTCEDTMSVIGTGNTKCLWKGVEVWKENNGQICMHGSCQKCTNNTQCGHQVCNNGICQDCGPTMKCTAPLVCIDGKCHGCSKDSDCKGWEQCVNDGNYSICQAKRCKESKDCGDYYCSANETCAPCTKNTNCSPDNSSSCLKDGTCGNCDVKTNNCMMPGTTCSGYDTKGKKTKGVCLFSKSVCNGHGNPGPDGGSSTCTCDKGYFTYSNNYSGPLTIYPCKVKKGTEVLIGSCDCVGGFCADHPIDSLGKWDPAKSNGGLKPWSPPSDGYYKGTYFDKKPDTLNCAD